MATQNIEARTVKIEAVTSKSKFPKFNSGALLIGDKWINVARKVDIRQFEKGSTVNLDIETNEKGYESVVGVTGLAPKATTAPVAHYTETGVNDAKSNRILRQGAIQAAVQALAMSGLTTEELAKQARILATDMIDFVEHA